MGSPEYGSPSPTPSTSPGSVGDPQKRIFGLDPARVVALRKEDG